MISFLVWTIIGATIVALFPHPVVIGALVGLAIGLWGTR